MFRREHVAAFSLAMASIHCTTVENGPIPDPTTGLDETAFRAKVEPILVKQCSYNACHGNTGSALRIYAPGTLRQLAYPTIDETMAPLTAEEEHANFVNAAAFSATAPIVDDNWLLRKPLASSAGGFEHKGGVIYLRGTNDPNYTVIYCWLTGGKAC
jgi:hypothetical protein